MFTMDALSNLLPLLQNLYIMHMSITIRIWVSLFTVFMSLIFFTYDQEWVTVLGLCCYCLCPPSWKNGDISDHWRKYTGVARTPVIPVFPVKWQFPPVFWELWKFHLISCNSCIFGTKMPCRAWNTVKRVKGYRQWAWLLCRSMLNETEISKYAMTSR